METSDIWRRIINAVDGDDTDLAAMYMVSLSMPKPKFLCPVCGTYDPVQKRKLQSTITFPVCNACGLKTYRAINNNIPINALRLGLGRKSSGDAMDISSDSDTDMYDNN